MERECSVPPNDPNLPADVVVLVVLCLCNLSFNFVVKFLGFPGFLRILYPSLTTQLLLKRRNRSLLLDPATTELHIYHRSIDITEPSNLRDICHM